MSYLHGIEIKEASSPVIVAEGDTAIIGLVGTAPEGAVGEAKLITSLTAGKAEFGEDIGGFTIPAALEVIFGHVSAKVLVVNVLSNADASALIDDGKMILLNGEWATGIGKAEIPETTDYSGEITGGLELLPGLEDSLGLKPNVIIVPGYSQLEAIAQKMIEIAVKCNGFAVIDIAADSVEKALEARASGSYNIGSPAAVLCFPRVIRYNSNEEENQPVALSAYWAAAKATTDAVKGYWFSPSNFQLIGALRPEINVRGSLTDYSADTNLLNAQGIVTVLRRSGTGYRTWGNWTSAYPADITPAAQIAPRAVRMMMREALIDASLNFMDRTVVKMTVELILNSVNAFVRGLIGKGAIFTGECRFEESLNPTTEIAQGKLVFTLSVAYGPSLERLTFNEVVDVENYKF